MEPMAEGKQTSMDPIRLLIVDDHPVVRDGIRGMLSSDPDFEVVGEAADGAEAIARAEAFRPDVVLMDLRMPGIGGVEATRAIVDSDIGARVLILTTFDTEGDVVAAIEAGATGYLLKDASRADLVRAVRSAADGEPVLSPPAARRLIGQVRKPSGSSLSDRELEVLSHVASGATNKELAAQLFISEATVKTHLIHVFEKLDVSDRAAAVAAAYELGLITPGGSDR